ncbi:NUDIX hydrolase [Pseudonocardia sp. C8]|uniref:NUDIX hydrolase n=1 Tax=Pseudonocardia sp. C8 TaxID=2762759 RepID=UPI00164304CB|nr:NUDIX hydrolase [Pseudonocardia sp. C8]MBC3192637.1 NUDIX hydrolase [Pseudonocardia sp. C8]
MSAPALVACAALIVVAALTVWCTTRVRRLHRLHVRVDAARAGLGMALDRRVAVALRVADVLGPPGNRRVRAAATALAAGPALAPDGRDPAGSREARETAENVLTRQLAAVDPAGLPGGLAAELADAQQLVVLARRVHNDAVRDTRVLRSRRLVRWLRLHGSAPEPVYFEIADPEPPVAPGDADVESWRHPTAM